MAALLGDHDILGEFDESLQTAWARWAFDLWGLADGQRRMSTTTAEKPAFADRREHCSADPRALRAVGVIKGQQVRVKRSRDIYALYTVSDERTENADNVVRMGLTGRRRLAIDEEFDAEFDSQVVHPTMSDEQAEKNGEFIERLHDDGRYTGLIVIAPHGGDIEVHTDDQAQRVACCLADKAVSLWLCKGYHRRGAEKTWHITSVDIHPGSFPCSTRYFRAVSPTPSPCTVLNATRFSSAAGRRRQR